MVFLKLNLTRKLIIGRLSCPTLTIKSTPLATSWETQGDFIFFRTTCTQLGTWNWNFGLEILCEDHEYWVKALKGDEIFKDGVKLDDEVKKPLNFGDTFTMIKRRNDISGGLAIFSFEKREYRNLLEYCRKTCASDNAKELNFMLDRNQLIFSKVLSHLSVRSLKNARLVCRHWDEEVTPVLQKKCAIKFVDDWKTFNPSLKFSPYIGEMRNVSGWPNWKITFPDLPAKEDDQKNFGAKFVIDLNWFLKPRRGHLVKTLSLRGDILSDQDYGLRLDTVSRFEDTLEELCVHFEMRLCNSDGTEKEFSSRPGLCFKVLKKLSLELSESMFSSSQARPDTLTASWMKTWADAVKHVTSISIIGEDILGSRFVQELQTTGTSRYKNLREITLTCKPEDGINFLADLNQPLSKMTLTIPLKNRHLPDFEDLLKKFAPSLELLSFRVSMDKLKKKSRFLMNMPRFPKLKSLDIHFGEDDFLEDGNWYCFIKNVPRLSLAFPPLPGSRDDVIDYGRHLPEIRSIVVTPNMGEDDEDDFWDTYSDLIDSLLPNEVGQSCKTLQNFVILRDDIEPETLYLQAARLPEIFPNVRNEWMVSLRGMIDN
ncbi:uncharacterized protein LOC118433495 [Folsomia candida]|uniref:uncharacterized protein LOC118433495 n=1 Tax=Folsomia candida TaxID=158441 RepID=UPI0016051DE5|nr:uncharacterized protein LOC118433495 [Folsomia candida]